MLSYAATKISCRALDNNGFLLPCRLRAVFDKGRLSPHISGDMMLEDGSAGNPDPCAQKKLALECIRKGGGAVHFVGVCGVGMAGLAYLLARAGFRVSGCDLHRNELADWLEQAGVPVAEGHDPAHVRAGPDWLVVSTAVPCDGEELVAARARGLPVLARGVVLAAVLEGCPSVAVCGTHGKTSTSSMIAHVLRMAGRDVSYCIGGDTRTPGGVAAHGSTDLLVVEADESDGTLPCFVPMTAVITNIEYDHADYFEDEAAVRTCFRRVAENAARVIYCADDPGAQDVCSGLATALSFGFGSSVFFRGINLEQTSDGLRFAVRQGDRELGFVELPVPGVHNGLNALAACAVALEAGLPFEAVVAALGCFRPVRRRFDRLVDRPDLLVVSDYAHHPSELRAVLATPVRDGSAPSGTGRRLVVFQPHRYSRTEALADEFVSVLAEPEELVLLPVYAASEPPIAGGTSWALYSRFRVAGMEHVRLAESFEAVGAYVAQAVRPGDTVYVLGAGSVEKVASALEERLAGGPSSGRTERDRRREGFQALGVGAQAVETEVLLSGKTSLGVGGCADVFYEAQSIGELVRVLRWLYDAKIPWWVFGAGSNILASDFGVRGVVIRLAGPDFVGISVQARTVRCGAGLTVHGLLNALAGEGRSGLEFLEGIPGTVGGALRMNAGAAGDEIGKHVRWVRCVQADGSESTLDAGDLDFGYRSCASLVGTVVVEACLAVETAAPAAVKAERNRLARRRDWLRGLRCAGSIFKNPAGDCAGRLLDECGLKGVAVGKARVCQDHANVIVTERGAPASDVWALTCRMRWEVYARFGVELAMEVETVGW